MIHQKARVKTFKIDGKDVTGKSNQTILEVANENGIDIPTLCYMKGLSCVGACRMCLVEVAGSRGLVPACTGKIKEGMEIITQSERLEKHRKFILSMIFSERNHICSVCVSNGHCELQDMTVKLNMEHALVPNMFPKYEIDASHERYIYDPNRCILCTRCVRVCDEVEGAHAWDLVGRGIATRVIQGMDEPWGESEACTSCGKCVHVCPTGTLSEKGLSPAEMVKKKNIIIELLETRSNRRDS